MAPLIPPGMQLPKALTQYEPAPQLQDIMHQQALQRAQQLQTQQAEIATQQKQQAFDQENTMREALQAEFSTQEDPDLAKGLETAKRIAFQNGDLDTALNIEKATRARSESAGNRILTDVEATQLGVPIGTSLSVANALLRARDLENVQARFTDPTRAGIRDWDLKLKEQKATGTEFEKISDTELGKIQNSEGALRSIDEVNSLLQSVTPGAFSALAAGKVTDLYKDPGSAAYRMYATLDLLKKQVARMNDSGALTQLDVDMFAPLTVGSPIYDDPQSLAQRMQDLTRYIAGKKESIIRTNEQGFRNMERFKTPTNPDDLANSLVGQQDTATAADEQAYKEQYKAKMRASRR